MIRLKMAVRNLFRNRRRTAVNIVMIVSGFCAIVVFQGFASFILGTLAQAVIQGQHGHIQVAQNVFWDHAPVNNPKDRLISDERLIEALIKKTVPTKYVSGRLGFYGLISTGDLSVGAVGVGFDPTKETALRKNLILSQGHMLNSSSAFEVMIGKGLLHQLQAKVGDRLTLMAQTVNGSINALDVKLVGVAGTGVAQIDDVTFYLPVKVAQKLMDTKAVDRVVVMLPKTDGFRKYEAAIQAVLPKGLGTRNWQQLTPLYTQSVSFFNLQNGAIDVIILVLVLLSIINTVGSSVVERTGEIGTMRALGERRREVVSQFMLEGTVLVVLGGVISVIVAILLAKLLTALAIPLPVPGSTEPFPIQIPIIPMAFVKAFLITSSTTLIATYFPAARGARLEIVEALKRNI